MRSGDRPGSTATAVRVRRVGRHAVAAGLRTPVRRAVLGALGLLLVAMLGVVVAAGFGPATAGEHPPVPRPVPADQVRTIQTAALSCPALSPARLAGQLMAASGFDPNARSSAGAGVAGLSDAQWNRWKPVTTAQRTDPTASIIALAHAMCDLVGQVREVDPDVEPWPLALAAYRCGFAAVRAAGAVPAVAASYVDTVSRLADWYESRPELLVPTSTPLPAPPVPDGAPQALPVPAAYLALVRSAGQSCSRVTRARIAAQLMAASAFNPNLLGDGGAQGIAGFTPQLWARYAAHPGTTSPWDPTAAIPALGRAMCALTSELSGLDGDPYPAAVAAFAWGPDAVRRAGGVPPALRDHVDQVQWYAGYYATDPGLNQPVGGAGSPTARPGPDPGATSSAGAGRPTPTVTATARRSWQTRVVQGTSVLTPGQAWSTDRLRLTLRGDGEVALVDQGRTVWRAGTAGKGGGKLVFQADGNLALYDAAGSWLWSTGTEGNDGAVLTLQTDGNVTISVSGHFLWHTGTQD